jgi:hypothetical protein
MDEKGGTCHPGKENRGIPARRDTLSKPVELPHGNFATQAPQNAEMPQGMGGKGGKKII